MSSKNCETKNFYDSSLLFSSVEFFVPIICVGIRAKICPDGEISKLDDKCLRCASLAIKNRGLTFCRFTKFLNTEKRRNYFKTKLFEKYSRDKSKIFSPVK